MNENPSLESNVRLPRQVVQAGQNARALLAKGAEADDPDNPIPKTDAAPAAPRPEAFTYEELLRAPTPEKDASRDYWKARCNVLEGYRRDDNQKTAKRVEALEAQVRDLMSKNAELVREKAQTPAATTIPEAEIQAAMTKRFTAEEIDAFGEERAMALTREFLQAGKSMDAALAAMRDQVNALLKRQETAAEDEATKRHRLFIEALYEGFPTWEETNKDARWLKWLEGMDRATGLNRQRLLNILSADKNALGIVTMLEAFVTSLKPAATPKEPPENPATLDGTGGDNRPPGDLLANELPLTDAEIRDGYRRKSIVGKDRFTPEEAAAFDKRVEAQMKRKGRA